MTEDRGPRTEAPPLYYCTEVGTQSPEHAKTFLSEDSPEVGVTLGSIDSSLGTLYRALTPGPPKAGLILSVKSRYTLCVGRYPRCWHFRTLRADLRSSVVTIIHLTHLQMPITLLSQWSAHSTPDHAAHHAHPSLTLRRCYQGGERALKATCLDVGIDAWCNAKFLQVLLPLHRTHLDRRRRLLLCAAAANLP